MRRVVASWVFNVGGFITLSCNAPPTLADRPLFSQPLQHASSQKLRQATKKQLPRVIDCTRHEANAKGLAEYSVFLDEDTEES